MEGAFGVAQGTEGCSLNPPPRQVLASMKFPEFFVTTTESFSGLGTLQLLLIPPFSLSLQELSPSNDCPKEEQGGEGRQPWTSWSRGLRQDIVVSRVSSFLALSQVWRQQSTVERAGTWSPSSASDLGCLCYVGYVASACSWVKHEAWIDGV